MQLDLDKQDLISLAKGTVPNYLVMSNPIIKKQGSFNSSQGDWNWNYIAFEECSEEEILSVYQVCKDSWK